MLKRCFTQSFIILVTIALLGIIAVATANAQGVLSPKLLRQDGATNGQQLCWSDANGYWGPCTVGGLTSLNGLTGATQTFADVDDTNVTVAISSTGTTHTWTLGWSGVLGLSRGGTGADLSATGGANQFVRQSSTGAVFTVGAIADADVPNTITIDLAATATALAANPNDCSAGQYATTIAANGDLTCAQVAWSQIGSTTDVIGTTQLDDDADTPGSGEYIRVDTVDQAGFEYRTTAEVLSDIGAAASAHTHGASTIDEDAVGTSELDDDANTPAAGSFVVVETGAASFDYVAANAGTDITADLEEETHASEHAENAADELLVEALGTACTTGQVAASDGSGGLDCTSVPTLGNNTPTAWATAIAATCDSTVAGKIVPVTGALVDWIECSNASGSYEWLMRINGRRWQIPTLSAWTQTSASNPATTTTQRNGAIEMLHPTDTGTDGEWEFYHRAQPSTPYSFTALFRHLGGAGGTGSDHVYAGIGFRESADDDYSLGTIVSNIGTTGNWLYRSTFWTSKTTPSTSYADTANITYTSVVDGPVHTSMESASNFYICITNDGTTNRTVSTSLTGITFTQIDTQTFNTDLTPDQIVFGNNSDNAGDQTTFFTGFAIRTGSTDCGAF